jgi:hypothetical protein
MEIVALWTLVIVGAGFFVAFLLDDLMDPAEDRTASAASELDDGVPAH